MGFPEFGGMDLKIPFFFGLLYVGLRAAKKKDAVDQFKYSIEGIPSIQYERGGGVTLGIPIGITNNTKETFEIRSITAQIFGDNRIIGNIQTPLGFTIGAYGTTVFQLNVSLALTTTALSLISAIATKKSGYVLRITGKVVTSIIDVPIDVAKKLF